MSPPYDTTWGHGDCGGARGDGDHLSAWAGAGWAKAVCRLLAEDIWSNKKGMGRVSWAFYGSASACFGLCGLCAFCAAGCGALAAYGGPMARLGDHAEAGGFRAVRVFEGNWGAVEAVLLATPRTRR